MTNQEVGSEQKNVQNIGGGSFNKGLGVPLRESYLSPPAFPDSGIQISAFQFGRSIQIWDNVGGVWIKTQPEVVYSSFIGMIDSESLINQSIIGIMGSGVFLVGGISIQTGYDFYKPLSSDTVTLLSGDSFVPNAPYLLIFGT